MLSALIPPEHSYPAFQLVSKPVHQRFVHPGPLVTYSHITMCADYIFTRPLNSGLGVGILINFKKSIKPQNVVKSLRGHPPKFCFAKFWRRLPTVLTLNHFIGKLGPSIFRRLKHPPLLADLSSRITAGSSKFLTRDDSLQASTPVADRDQPVSRM